MQQLKNKIFYINIVLALSFTVLLNISCKKNTNPINNNITELSSKDSLLLNKMLDSLRLNHSSINENLIKQSNKIALKFPENTADIYIKVAHIHFNKENYYLAKYYFTKASEEFKNNKKMSEYAEQLSNIGVVLEVSGFYSQALEKYFEALKIFEKLNLQMKTARVYSNIGIIYQKLKQEDKSIEYYRKALKIAQDNKNETVSANSYNNIATYFEEFKHNYDSALVYYKKAKEVYSTSKITWRLLIIENNIGIDYMLKNDLDKADSVLNSVLKTSLDNGFEDKIAPILNAQASLNIKQKKYNSAIEKSKNALVLAKKAKNKELELECLNIITNVYEKQGNYEKYSEFIKPQLKLKEELNGIELKKQINVLNVKYEVFTKNSQIEILKLNNDVKSHKILQLWLLIIIIVLLSSGIVLFLYLQRKNNKLINNQMRRDIAGYINKINEFETEQKIEKEQVLKDRDTQILEQTKLFNLTERENDVLLLIARGYKNTKIADTLFVSVNTVKYHTKNIFIKLDVKNRIEAVQKAQGL